MSCKKLFVIFFKIIFGLFGLGAMMILIPNLIIRKNADGKLFNVDDAKPVPVAIVFGAGLYRDGSPMPVLKERIETAVALYDAGKVEKLLMTGDNRFEYYDEPTAMFEYAIELGVPEEDIVRDFAGRRTYDSCVRAKAIFGISEAILVTQEFHVGRAIYLCEAEGIAAQGVPSTGRVFRTDSEISWKIREVFARMVAFWDVHFIAPSVVLGDEEFIFPTE